jgi:hypothetical protein
MIARLLGVLPLLHLALARPSEYDGMGSGGGHVGLQYGGAGQDQGQASLSCLPIWSQAHVSGTSRAGTTSNGGVAKVAMSSTPRLLL